MTHDVADDSSEWELLQPLDSRDSHLARLFSVYRDRLERMVEFRLDPRLRGRIDTADVLQEAYLVISKRVSEYLAAPRVSLFVWFRRMTLQCMIDLHRLHFREKRNVGREIKLTEYDPGGATSLSIAHALVDPLLSPSRAAVRAEEVAQLTQALKAMDEIDREVLALRHFEHLSNKETAEALGLSPTAASNRYVRAMARLSSLMEAVTRSGMEKI
jgi:RNA polymerase sigma-70 factor, ECF subfamily